MITIERAKGLRSKGSQVPQTAGSSYMLPFFSYDFYIYSHQSANGQGPDCVFDSVKTYQCEDTPEFKKYMETQQLRIDVIDDAVKIQATQQQGALDYIGSARINLVDVYRRKEVRGVFPVVDEQSNQRGELSVAVRMEVGFGLYSGGGGEDYAMTTMTSSAKI